MTASELKTALEKLENCKTSLKILKKEIVRVLIGREYHNVSEELSEEVRNHLIKKEETRINKIVDYLKENGIELEEEGENKCTK